MNKNDFEDEIKIEFENIGIVINELQSILDSVGEKEPISRDKTAAASYLSQFYNGIENILKRISRFKNVELPKGELWHKELFERFCSPPFDNLPLIFTKELEIKFIPYRKFRHVVIHGYSFKLEWSLMKRGIEQIEYLFNDFKEKINSFIKEELQSNGNE